MKLNSFVAGIFGIVGFVVSVFSGLIIDNPVGTILFKAVMWAAVCYTVGYIVGAIAQQVAAEHAVAIAKRVAESDKLQEVQEAEEQARKEAEAVTLGENGAATAEAIANTPVVPGKI